MPQELESRLVLQIQSLGESIARASGAAERAAASADRAERAALAAGANMKHGRGWTFAALLVCGQMLALAGYISLGGGGGKKRQYLD